MIYPNGFCFKCHGDYLMALLIGNDFYRVYHVDEDFNIVDFAGTSDIAHAKEYVNNGFWNVVALVRKGKFIK